MSGLEVLGIVASIVQVAGAGLQLSKSLYDYADSVANSDKRAKDIAQDVRLTSLVIEELGGVLQTPDVAKDLSKNAASTADEAIRECHNVFKDISETLRKNRQNLLGKVIGPFRESKVQLLRANLDRLKSSLTLLLSVISYAYQRRIGSSQGGSDQALRDQIAQLIEEKKQANRRYEASLRAAKDSDDDENTLVNTDSNTSREPPESEASSLDGPVFDPTINLFGLPGVKPQSQPDVATMAARGETGRAPDGSLTSTSLLVCMEHIRGLLASVANAEKILAASQPGCQEQAQGLMQDTYRVTKRKLDSIILPSIADTSTFMPNPAFGTASHGPKKQKTTQEMSVGDFLGEQTLGSWADEMENLRPAIKRERSTSRARQARIDRRDKIATDADDEEKPSGTPAFDSSVLSNPAPLLRPPVSGSHSTKPKLTLGIPPELARRSRLKLQRNESDPSSAQSRSPRLTLAGPLGSGAVQWEASARGEKSPLEETSVPDAVVDGKAVSSQDESIHPWAIEELDDWGTSPQKQRVNDDAAQQAAPTKQQVESTNEGRVWRHAWLSAERNDNFVDFNNLAPVNGLYLSSQQETATSESSEIMREAASQGPALSMLNRPMVPTPSSLNDFSSGVMGRPRQRPRQRTSGRLDDDNERNPPAGLAAILEKSKELKEKRQQDERDEHVRSSQNHVEGPQDTGCHPLQKLTTRPTHLAGCSPDREVHDYRIERDASRTPSPVKYGHDDDYELQRYSKSKEYYQPLGPYEQPQPIVIRDEAPPPYIIREQSQPDVGQSVVPTITSEQGVSPGLSTQRGNVPVAIRPQQQRPRPPPKHFLRVDDTIPVDEPGRRRNPYAGDLMVLDTPLLRVSRPVAACSRCRVAKVKCDGKLPACTACKKSNKAAECSSTNDQFARGHGKLQDASEYDAFPQPAKNTSQSPAHKLSATAPEFRPAPEAVSGLPPTVHSAIVTNSCDVCKKQFRGPYESERHQRVYHGAKPVASYMQYQTAQQTTKPKPEGSAQYYRSYQTPVAYHGFPYIAPSSHPQFCSSAPYPVPRANLQSAAMQPQAWQPYPQPPPATQYPPNVPNSGSWHACRTPGLCQCAQGPPGSPRALPLPRVGDGVNGGRKDRESTLRPVGVEKVFAKDGRADDGDVEMLLNAWTGKGGE